MSETPSSPAQNQPDDDEPLFLHSSPPLMASSPPAAGGATPGSIPPSSPLIPPSDGMATPTQHVSSSPLNYASSSPVRGSTLSERGDRQMLSSDALSVSYRSTPRFNRRGDVLGSEGMRYPEFSAEEPYSEDASAPRKVIWGTNVSIQQAMSTFKKFLTEFSKKYRMSYDKEEIVLNDDDSEKKVYMIALKTIWELGQSNLNLDFKDLLAYPPTVRLAQQLINYPQEIVPLMDQVIKDVILQIVSDAINNETGDARREDSERAEETAYKVRVFGLINQKGMRELNPGDIDKLVSVKGLVLRTTPVIPDMRGAFFRCTVCHHTTVVEIDRGIINEPTQCPRQECRSKNSMQLIHNRSSFSDKQVIKLQETPDETPDGQTPHSVSLLVYDDLVDVAKAGDRVEVTGIFRSVAVRTNPRLRTLKSLFKTYIDIVHIQKVDKKRMDIDTTTENGSAPVTVSLKATQSTTGSSSLDQSSMAMETNEESIQEDSRERSVLSVDQDNVDTRKISQADIDKINEIASRDDIYEILSRSLAPSIYEHDDVKKGILLQLFGGTNKTFSKGGSPRYRGDINILLCGDPSTAKSQLLQYVHKIAPRGIYTSGKGSSAVGLTAYVTRDQETRQLVLESGALVLSDGGICCIDEFDKMNDSTRSVLHEVMEQQTVSVAKAGIITTLNARTSILASANPIGSKYDPKLSVPQNIDLPPTLLSRFDLVYLLLDKIDERADRQLAAHLTSMYLEDRPENAASTEIMPIEFLTMYISYAKQHIHPKLTEMAKQELVKAYVAMRKVGEDVRVSEKRITATTRQLESMIRLSEAHAKMRLSEWVTADDAIEAVRLIRAAIKEYAMDPLTGTIDMDLVQTGESAAQRRRRLDLSEALMRIISAAPTGAMRYDELLAQLNEGPETVDNLELGNALRQLEREGTIVMQDKTHQRIIRKA